MKLYVIRHGETEKGKNKIIADIKEDINKNGINQAKEAGKILKNLNINLVICSPYIRTKNTLKLLNLDNIKVIYDDALKERDMGKYENAKFEDLDWDLFWNYYDTTYTELESMKSVYDRVKVFLEKIKKEYKDKNILLVTHGGTFRAIDWNICGIPENGNILKDINNCEIREYEL